MSVKIKINRVALISGVTGYLGSEVARILSKDGYYIAGLYKSSEKPKDDLIQSFSGTGHKIYGCHLEDLNDISKVLKEIQETQGKITVLIHSAWAKSARKKLEDCTPDEIKAELNGNVLNSFNLISSCAKIFKDQKEGKIIGITTVGVIIPEAAKNLGTYILGKQKLQEMLGTFRKELAPDVSVYSIAPGFMQGGINKDIPNAFVEMMKQKSPNKKITNASEVADIISKLCVDKIKPDDMTILIAPEYDKK